jgi:hypothetical protein
MSAARRPLAELAAAIPLLPQQQRAVSVRHKDQWEGSGSSGRSRGDGLGAGASCVRRARCGAPGDGRGRRVAHGLADATPPAATD